ncbi:YegP family protein [Gammaproteobacteria bacterium]|nr:YegP family protein [Gammaproteobacteria bacterium]MDC1147343.1 YegP family protein [Gammaproteobacteria bacterium]
MFQIYKDKAGKHRFRLKAKNGENIISSQAYASLATCMKGIKSVAKHSADKANFQSKENKAGKWNFNLVAANNRVVATSQSYADKSSMNKGIKSVMTNAPKMKIS